MPKRRNYSTREIIEVEPIDLAAYASQGQGATDTAGSVIDGGSNVDVIGVPKNFRVVSQEVVDYFGEYRVNVVIEFDSVNGASEYQGEHIQETTGSNAI